jgi:hypothetical protein
MSNQEFTKEIEAAVNWWAAMLGKKASASQAQIGGIDGRALDIALAMGYEDEKNEAITAEQIELFKSSLAENLKHQIANNPYTLGGNGMGVDYDPDPILRTAMEMAGIDDYPPPFPFKTKMWIVPGKVTTAVGRGSAIETVYQA